MESLEFTLEYSDLDSVHVSIEEMDALILEYGGVYCVWEEYEGKSEIYKNLFFFDDYVKILVKKMKRKSNKVGGPKVKEIQKVAVHQVEDILVDAKICEEILEGDDFLYTMQMESTPSNQVSSKKDGSVGCRPGMGIYNGIKAVAPVAWSSRLYITLVRGLPGTRKLHRRTLKALGLQKCQRIVVKDNTSSIRGMINQVKRLVAVETEEMYKARKQRTAELGALRPPIVAHHPHHVYSCLELSQKQEGQVQS